ncbi:MAG: hypothetical protein JSS21_11365 [Proteobacteria bacterium]|nr:hypothetical protein [Pseudomonadota bacterium]
MNDELLPDGPPTPKQQRRIEALSQLQLDLIDKTLLANSLPRWRKVAMVVALSMELLESTLPEIPDVFFSQRVQRLVSLGLLEAQGDLSRMRFSEIRLPDK